MAFKRGERDHRDMLSHDNPTIKSKDPVYYSKPEWMVEAPNTRSNVALPSRLPPYLTHDEPAPSLDAYTSKPAPFSEDGYSAFRRDADYSTSYKLQSLAEKTKPGQKRNAGPRQGYGQMESRPLRDDEALWNFTRRTPIKERPGELEKEFRAQKGNTSQTENGTNVMDGYTPTTTPPIRSAGSDRTPSKSIYQEQCDQIWAHHRGRAHNNNSVAASNADSPAGRATSNVKFNPFTGAREGVEKEMEHAKITRQYQEDRERQRQTEDALPNHYPPWATHEGEEGALLLKNG